MTTVHDPLPFICGDTWKIAGPLTDEVTGLPLSLTGARLQWLLDGVDVYGNPVRLIELDNGTNGGVVITDMPSASILVTVPKAQTLALSPGGLLTDYLRVTLLDGSLLTCWTGVIRAAPAPV